MRKLASIKRIDDIIPIENADSIETALIGGWKVVIKKNEFQIGDLVIYFEIDSWIPKEIAPFLFKGRTFDSIEGERLRTVKLRGQISQGLVLPLSLINENNYKEGDDLTEILGIKKYEIQLSSLINGLTKGNFPHFIPKTDQERLQNIKIRDIINRRYEVTEKLDGSSLTIYKKDGEWGVCSRNLELKLDVESTFVNTAKEFIELNSMSIISNIAFQGEIIGPGVQRNKYKKSKHEFYIFDVFDIDKQEYLLPADRYDYIKELKCNHVPILEDFDCNEETSIDYLLNLANGKSQLNDINREGLVFKEKFKNFSFKVISNDFLLKLKD